MGDLGPNSTQAQNRKGFAFQFDPLECLAVPFPGLHGCVRLCDRTCCAQHVREGQFGSSDRVAGRGVDHHDPALRCGIDVDVVNPDARPSDDLKLGGRSDDVGVDEGFTAYDDCRCIGHQPKHLLLG
ncbi:MAG: hypothetical protein BWY82_02059 [Verrucomicrobia bacterium ADurb.Bin474]|nr:MAG: hypothetical protein BWY82_02059 [Verrucomicrobia bacterium ADurb.Bin474]